MLVILPNPIGPAFLINERLPVFYYKDSEYRFKRKNKAQHGIIETRADRS
jgi:hypothetical protein